MARNKAKAPSAEDVLKLMYPDLPTSEDYTDPIGSAIEAEKAKGQQTQDNVQLTELQKQVALLQGQLNQTTRANGALMQQAKTDLPPAQPQFDMSKAPDPTLDPGAYAQFILGIADAKVQYEKDVYAWQARQQNDIANKTQNLWDSFAGKYGDLAKNSKQVEIATVEVINRAKAQGRDVDKYMYGASDQFMDDVAAEIGKLWPGASAAAADDDDEGDEDRTDMLGGGAGGNGVASGAGRKAPPEKYGALSTDVLAWQKATGFHG